MPSPRSTEPVYVRGKYRLIKRPDRTNYDIVWYDEEAKRDRSRSSGRGTLGEAKDALDALYLKREKGAGVCPTCHRPWDEKRRFLLVQSMLDYDLTKRKLPSYEAIKARLAHVHAYLVASDQLNVACEDIDEAWIDNFWDWNLELPIVLPNGETRERAPSTVNNSVLQLAAAVNFSYERKDARHPAAFKAKQAKDVNRTPTYRSDIAELARMFEYALRYDRKRANLLHFLRISVATLVRPEHAHYLNADPAEGQWHPRQAVFNLLPMRAAQSNKRRPIVPIARQAVPWLNATPGPLIDAISIKSGWQRMQEELGLPGQGQAGPKLIRRSMATLIRGLIGQHNIPDLAMFLGHRESSEVTDLYAPFDPDYLQAPKRAIEAIIDELETLVPGAFHRILTAEGADVVAISSARKAA